MHWNRLALALTRLLLAGGAASPGPSIEAPPTGGETQTVTVTRVVDRDTIEVQSTNRTTDTIRLLGWIRPKQIPRTKTCRSLLFQKQLRTATGC
ncbi:hypothetical protein [Halocatena pleomorpha]|uniref:Uncharacterized protein n=1 Tax=Halocatena pleomorpha TaxID=1785090 RepID=A0A3P3R929_9EURY|nr:hypothetical protein [Halocatena pleomorpha]RRJ29967.1 hypothetical protein EIK79_11495 [Halocatena pleomorpha]